MTPTHPVASEEAMKAVSPATRLRFWLWVSDFFAPLYYRARPGSWLERPYIFTISRAADAEWEVEFGVSP